MDFERLTDAQHPMYHTAMALYQKSFPPHEQREAPSQERILHHPEYHYSLVFPRQCFLPLLLALFAFVSRCVSAHEHPHRNPPCLPL